MFIHIYDCSKSFMHFITNHHKDAIQMWSIIICLWHMENYQLNNKKIADVYKWMLKANNEYEMDWLDIKWRTVENYQAENNKNSDLKKKMELDWTRIT
jgi:hypothetical protein